jgi:V/A-type H+-transporting ATPase subunit E
VPDDFIERCNAGIKDGSVKLEGETDRVKSGFIIVYGKIEQNCSVDSLFDTNKNRIWDSVNKSLGV